MSGDVRMGYYPDKQRIWVTFSKSKEFAEAVKLVDGSKFHPQQMYWHFPLTMEVARDIQRAAEKCNMKVRVTPELAKWAAQEKKRYADLLKPDDFTTDVSDKLPHLRATRPKLIAAMEAKPWQIPGAAFMVGQKNTLLADVPGLGKTIQTLATVAELDMRGLILVVAPRTAVSVTWPDEIAKWLGPEHVFIINADETPEDRTIIVKAAKAMADMGERVWVLCGPNYLRAEAEVDDDNNYVRDAKGNKILRVVNEGVAELFRVTWSAIIVDECHQTLAGAPGNKKRQSAQRQGLGLLKLAPGGLKIAISGTPFRGKTENLWGVLNWLQPKVYTSYWKWIDRHYGTTKDLAAIHGSGIVKGDYIIDEKRFFMELRPIMVRRTMAEVEPYRKPLEYGGTRLIPGDDSSPKAVWLPMTLKQKRMYDQVVKDAVLNFDTENVNVNGVLAEMIRFKQLANAGLKKVGFKSNGEVDLRPDLPSNKVEWIENFLSERIAEGTKVIVASQFTQFIYMLSECLKKKKIDHYVLTGDTEEADRKIIKDSFQDPNGHRVILLNTKAGGVSLTLDLADDVVVCDQTWVPDDQEQVELRAYRVSREHRVTVWNLASLGTIDEDVAVINAERSDAIFSILDGQRGVTYVQKLIKATKIRQGLAA